MLVNVLLVETEDGYLEVINQGYIDGDERLEDHLSLADVRGVEEATRTADATIARLGLEQVSIEAEYEETLGPVPYDDYLPGAGITVPDINGDPILMEVVAVTVSADKEGHPFVLPEFGFVEEAPIRRLIRTTRRMTPGAIGGRSESVMPSGSSRSASSTGGIAPIAIGDGFCAVVDAHATTGMAIADNTRTEVTFVEWATTNIDVTGGHVFVPRSGWYIETIQAMWAIAPVGSVNIEYGSAGGQPPAASAIVDGYDIDPVGDGRFYFSHGNSVVAYLPEGMELYCHATQTSGIEANLVHLFLGLAYICGDLPTVVTVGS